MRRTNPDGLVVTRTKPRWTRSEWECAAEWQLIAWLDEYTLIPMGICPDRVFSEDSSWITQNRLLGNIRALLLTGLLIQCFQMFKILHIQAMVQFHRAAFKSREWWLGHKKKKKVDRPSPTVQNPPTPFCFVFSSSFVPVWISLYTFTAQIFQLILFSKCTGLKRCLKKVFIHAGKARIVLQIFTWATLCLVVWKSLQKMSSRS